jgi:hypothetical protein
VSWKLAAAVAAACNLLPPAYFRECMTLHAAEQLPHFDQLGSKLHFVSKNVRKKANSGLRLTPEGLRPQQPQRGGRTGGNARQHGTRTATREGAKKNPPNRGPRPTPRGQGTVHQASSTLAFTSRHRRISNRSPNQKDKAGKNRAHTDRGQADKKQKGFKRHSKAS